MKPEKIYAPTGSLQGQRREIFAGKWNFFRNFPIYFEPPVTGG
jgi:hypothetical protein